MDEKLVKAEEDIDIFRRVGDRGVGTERDAFDITEVDKDSPLLPNEEKTERILKSITNFINANVHLRENTVAKQTVSKLALSTRVNPKIVNELIRDLEGLK